MAERGFGPQSHLAAEPMVPATQHKHTPHDDLTVSSPVMDTLAATSPARVARAISPEHGARACLCSSPHADEGPLGLLAAPSLAISGEAQPLRTREDEGREGPWQSRHVPARCTEAELSGLGPRSTVPPGPGTQGQVPAPPQPPEALGSACLSSPALGAALWWLRRHHRGTGLLSSQQRARELPWPRRGPQTGHCELAWQRRPRCAYLFEVTLVLGEGKFHCVVVCLLNIIC